MDAELTAIPLVAVGNPEAHHASAGLEVRHASGQPVVDRAGTDAEAPGDLPLAYPSAPRGITWMSWVAWQGGACEMPQLAERDGNQGGIESSRFFHVGMFNGFRSRFLVPGSGDVRARGLGRCRPWPPDS